MSHTAAMTRTRNRPWPHGLADVGSLARRTVRVILTAWIVVPLAALAIAVAAGRSSITEAADLVVWLVLPWAAVLASLGLVALVLGPGARRRTDRNDR